MAKKDPRRKQPSKPDERQQDESSGNGADQAPADDTPDSYSTLIPDSGEGSEVDLDKTAEFDSTVMMSGKEDRSTGMSTSLGQSDDVDAEHLSTVISADKTVGNVDQTVEIDPRQLEDTQELDALGGSVDPAARTVISRGRGIKTEADLRSADGMPSTTDADETDDLESTVQAETVGMRSKPDALADDGTVGDVTKPSSLMTSNKIGVTINPRELTEKDAEFWGSMVLGDSDQAPSVLPPAIDRSLTETKLQIRGRHVVTPRSDPTEPSDYRLMRLLGKGGMGNVYVAKQGSLDRIIAVKVIKPLSREKRQSLQRKGKLEQVERDRRQQFVAEAVVTSDLDHPNIVPIHDIAVTSDNTLFYSMKRVSGEPWSKTLQHNSLDENLDILLKVADAIALAHDRGVVHRDIKPENIMVGDYGVVMVMDWGLALAIPKGHFDRDKSVYASSGLGGTPAFMAPEMAVGPIERIGPGADIYLLGATLFMIVTGAAPHEAGNVSECLKAVAGNVIRPVSKKYHGELLNIALKAMATRPEDRFPNVASFQTAIREYRSHAESISLATRAAEDLQRAQQKQTYVDFSHATFRFEESIALWDGNQAAIEGLAETRLAHANAAYQNGDYDLGLSLLSEQVDEHKPIILKLQEGIEERDSRQSRLRVLRMAAAAMLAFILVGGSVALYLIVQSQREAVIQRDLALEQKENAIKQEKIAVEQRNIANEQRLVARQAEQVARDAEKIAVNERDKARIAKAGEEEAKNQAILERNAADQAKVAALAAEKLAKEQKLLAEQAKKVAEDATASEKEQRRIVEYQKYVAQIGLAKARIDRNEFDDAREILEKLQKQQADTLGWEWSNLKRTLELQDSTSQLQSPEQLRGQVDDLWKKATQTKVTSAQDAVIDLAVGLSGRTAVATLQDGSVELLSLDADGKPTEQRRVAQQDWAASAAAVDERKNRIAVGLTSGDIRIYDSQLRQLLQTLQGHEQAVTDLEFTPSGTLVSASLDRTARVWDPAEGTELAACWHITPVRDLDVVERGTSLTLATAIADNTSGQAVVWDVTRNTSGRMSARRVGEFLDHQRPVLAIALSPDGELVASGDSVGVVYLWPARGIKPVNYANQITSALASLERSPLNSRPRAQNTSTARRLVDPLIQRSERLISSGGGSATLSLAHENAVRAIQFNRKGELLSGSEDYTLKRWNIAAGKSPELIETLRGHGGWVTGVAFLQSGSDIVLSASNDASVRSWDLKTYQEIKREKVVESSFDTLKGFVASAHDDEIWSARFSPDGMRIVSASRDHTARVLELDPDTMSFNEVASLQPEDRLNEGTPYVGMSMVVDEQYGRLYVGSADSTVRVWDLERGTQIGEASRTGLNTSLTVSRSGRLMLTGSSMPDAKAILWKVDPQGDTPPTIIHRLQGHDQAVTALAISPDESLLFTGDRDGRGILWNTLNGKQSGTAVDAVRGFRINAAGFSTDGKELLIAADDQQLTRVNIQSRQIVGRLTHEGFVTQLSLSSNGKFALTVSEQITDERIRSIATLWEIVTEESRVIDRVDAPRTNRVKSADGGRARITSANFGAEYPVAIVSRSAAGGEPSRIQVWDIGSSAAEARMIQSFSLPAKLPSATAVIPAAGRTLLTLCGDAAFHWNLSSMTNLKSYRAHAAVTQASFSFDGRYVATGSRSVKIWDSKSGKSLGKLEVAHESPVRSIQFSRAEQSGYLFATGGDDGVAKTWRWDPQARSISPIAEYQTGNKIRSVCLSRDGEQLLAVGDNGSARLWRLDQSEQPTVYDLADAGNFTCANFSKHDAWIVVGSDDKRARMWRVVDPGRTPETTILLQGHADRIEDVALLEQDNQPLRVLTASRDRSARVWDPQIDVPSSGGEKLGRELMSLRRHTQGVTAIAVTDDAKLVMTAGRDGKVILWPAE